MQEIVFEPHCMSCQARVELLSGRDTDATGRYGNKATWAMVKLIMSEQRESQERRGT